MIGCGPHLEFLYKVALLIETALSSEENSACCLTGCCLPLDLTTCDKKKTTKKHTNEKNPSVQECSAVVVCLMITATNCFSYPLFDFAAPLLFWSVLDISKRN